MHFKQIDYKNSNNLPVSLKLMMLLFSLALIFPILLTMSCSEEVTSPELTLEDTNFEATDWSVATHGSSASPNFTEVFADNQVKRLDIVVTSARWQIMLADMTDIYGTFGSGPGGPGGGLTTSGDPTFVPAEVFYKDKQWYKVGIRFKGNSSLQSSWKSGILKLSIKLDFDEFEDNYPQINNQRFYGFKKLSLKNNYEDESFLREKVAAQIFANAGLAVSHTAFYELYVDHGDGPEYFGLYTLVEEVDDTVIETQFSNKNGNLYKPEDAGASFVSGSFNESDFEKKTNEDDSNWDDIKALFSALHAETRSSNPALWRTNLESVFDTDVFLKYLAVNTVIQNWDTYGRMPHNFYLYNNPENGKLTWIPWDNNEALRNGNRYSALRLDFSNISHTKWPLIEYLYADTLYKAKYDAFVKETIEGAFETSAVQAIYANYAALIQGYATSERKGYTFLSSSSGFQQAIAELNAHASNRVSAANYYLD